MKVFLSSDHAGFDYKNALFEHLVHRGVDVEDLGPQTINPDDDYPQFAFQATTKVLGSEDEDPRAILVCGSGQGMAIAANRVRGIRAAVIWNVEGAKETRHDNNSNVLSIPARMISLEDMFDIVDTWIKEPFSGAQRHVRRLQEIEDIYG